MKRCLLLTVFFFNHFVIFSQTIFDSAIRYKMAAYSFAEAADTMVARAYNPVDTGEENEVSLIKAWKEFVGNRISNDVPLGSDSHFPYSAALAAYMPYISSYCSGSSASQWTCLGPFIDYYGATSTDETQGRVNSLWVNPISKTILLGSASGGLWKSNNGGHTWFNLTDNALGTGGGIAAITGVNHIAVDPLDTNRIYIALNIEGQYNKAPGYNLGLAYSTDGGATWYQDVGYNAVAHSTGLTEEIKMAFMPGTHKLFAIAAYHVYYNDGSSWSDITPASSAWYFDLQFSKHTPGKLLVTTGASGSPNPTSKLWTTSDDGAHWSSISMDLTSIDAAYNQFIDHDGAYKFCVTSNDDAYMLFRLHCTSPNSCSTIVLIKTPISTFSPVLKRDDPSMGSFLDIQVSDANDDVIYAPAYSNGSSLHRSTDGGLTFSGVTGGHVDGRCVFLYSTNTNPALDEVYSGNDGGVRMKASSSTAHISITGQGLAINQFYGLGTSESDEDVIVGGAHDNGGFSYIRNRTDPWSQDEVDYDGGQAKMKHNTIQGALGERNSGTNNLYEWTFSGLGLLLSGVSYITAPSEEYPFNRRLIFDHNDNAYVGYYHIWKKTPGSSSWNPAFPTTGAAGEPHGTHGQGIADFYIDELDINKAYIAYLEAGIEKLFYSGNANASTPFWKDIGPAVVGGDRINSIVVDPKNHKRLWIGLGNVNHGDVYVSPSLMSNRVWHTEDASASTVDWEDVSKGLSALPVDKLLYRNGTDDEIYAGTDVGVFRWNKAIGSWECYNDGLPPCIVMDMEINYCANKLRISTYGRGIWEKQLDNINPSADNLTNIAGGASVTWTSDKYLESSVSVKPGGSLTISGCTVHMPKNGVIAVEPGGRLIVDNSTITNDCENCFWKGIEARGVATDPQVPTSNQGWVIIRNNSKIEHAITGVANSNRDVIWATNGGIIQCYGSTFINNQTDVAFEGYDNIWGGAVHPNLSHFSLCNFILDNNYKGTLLGMPMQNMVSLRSVEGITFSACKFLNRNNAFLQKGYGTGINAVNSAFNVYALCPSTPHTVGLCRYPTRSRFCGLGIGINIQKLWQPTLAVGIDQADFDSCSIGEYVSTFEDVSTTRCNFNIGHGRGVNYLFSTTALCGQNIGILSENSTRFKIEGNSFNGKVNGEFGWQNFGTVIGNTGPVTNNIFRNLYDTLDFGAYSMGRNASSGRAGLQIKCNTFVDNDIDIYVNGGGSSAGPGYTGLPNQASSGSSAGNTFTATRTHNIDNHTLYGFDYYYNIGMTPPEYPTLISGGPGTVSRFVVGTSASCTSTLFDPFGVVTAPYAYAGTATAVVGPTPPGPMPPPYKHDFYVAKADYTTLSATYTSLIDLGNTMALLAVIDTTTVGAPLYSLLSSGSPYLSRNVLTAAADKDVLNYGQMMNLLLQNPDDLHNKEFVEHINTDYSFSAADIDTINAYALHSTDRTTLENGIGAAQSSMSYNGNMIMLALKSSWNPAISIYDTAGLGICTDTNNVYFGLDSNAYYVGLDSVDRWLQNIGGMHTYYERAGFYDFMKLHTIADTIFADIPGIIPVGDSFDSVMHAKYTTLRTVIRGAEAVGRDAFHLTTLEAASLSSTDEAIFTSYTPDKIMWSISRFPRDGGFAPPPPVPGIACINPDGYKQAHGAAPHPKHEKSGNNQISVYPNPASGSVTFDFNVPNGKEDLTITVTNLLGEKIATLVPGTNVGKVLWDPKNIASGVYFYEAKSGGVSVSKGKLILTSK